MKVQYRREDEDDVIIFGKYEVKTIQKDMYF